MTEMIFHIPDAAEYRRLTTWFNHYRVEDLRQFLMEVRNLLPSTLHVFEGGREVPLEHYMPSRKSSYPKAELMRFASLVHCCPENLRQVVALYPKAVREVYATIIQKGYAACSPLAETPASIMFSSEDRWYRTDWYCGRYASILDMGTSLVPADSGQEKRNEGYLFIPSQLRELYCRALAPETTDSGHLYATEADGSYTRVQAESEFVSSIPPLRALWKGDAAYLKKNKISATEARRIMQKLPIRDVIPEAVAAAMKDSIGQYFLPFVFYSMSQDAEVSPQEHAKNIARYLTTYRAEFFYPILLPHLKGLRATVLREKRTPQAARALIDVLKEQPGQWVGLSSLSDYLHAGCRKEWFGGFPFTSYDLSRMPLVNTYTGDEICLDNEADEIDLALLGSVSMALYASGMLELALDPSDTTPDQPCGHIRQVRLTSLGRYALGIDRTYEPPKAPQGHRFRLLEEGLIVVSESGDNPYEGMVETMSEPAGTHRYRFSITSFLQGCNTYSDVQGRIQFFEDYLCPEEGLPPLWKDFFTEVRRRVYPLSRVNEPYVVLRGKEGEDAFLNVLVNTPSLRALFKMAEDRTLLIKENDYKRFCSELKKMGYLI